MMSIVGRRDARWLCPPGIETGLRESFTGLFAMGRDLARESVAPVDAFLLRKGCMARRRRR
jgi:hypothetical protein